MQKQEIPKYVQVIQWSDIEHSIFRFIQSARQSTSSDAQYKLIRQFALTLQDHLEADIKPVWLQLSSGRTVSNEYKMEHENE